MIKNKKSIYTILLISYATMLSLYIITISLLYLYNLNTIKSESIYSNLVTVENMQQKIDNIFMEVNKLNTQISLNSDISELLSAAGRGEENPKYLMQNIRLRLNDQLSICNYINQFCIYSDYLDCAITPSFTSSCDEFMSMYLGFDEKTISDFKRMLADTQLGCNLFYSESYPDKIIVAQNLHVIEDHPDNYIMVIIDKGMFSLSERGEYETGTLYIVDNNNRCIPLNADSIFNCERIDYNKTISYLKLGGEKYCTVQTKSAQTGYRYLSVIKESLFAKKLHSSRNIGVLFLTIYIALAIVLAKILLNYNYSPLDKLLKEIKKKMPDLNDTQNNEYSFIDETINNILAEKHELSHTLQNQAAALCQSAREKTLKIGLTKNFTQNDILQSLGIDPVSDNFIVCVLQFEDLSNLFNEDNLSPDKQESYALFITQNIMEELLSRHNPTFFTVVDVSLTFCVNVMPKNTDSAISQIEHAVCEASDRIAQSFNFSFKVAASSMQHFSAIHKAYKEACIAMEYAETTPDLQFVQYSEVINRSVTRYSFTLDAENRLVHLIKSGNRADVEKFMDEIFSDMYNGGALSLEMFKCLMFDIAGAMVKTAQDIFGQEKNQPFKPLYIIEKITNSGSVEELKDNMNTIIASIYDNLPQKDSICSPVISLIAQEYANPDLSVSYISEKVHLHPNYLSTCFKKQYGIGLLEYITNVRLKTAKELLITTHLTLDEIAVRVGYTSSQPLSRAFKKKEGVPPSVYRTVNS